MKWLVCKAEHEFNHVQQCSTYRAIECVQIFNTREDAFEARELFEQIDNASYCFFAYVVINSEQIGELVR